MGYDQPAPPTSVHEPGDSRCDRGVVRSIIIFGAHTSQRVAKVASHLYSTTTIPYHIAEPTASCRPLSSVFFDSVLESWGCRGKLQRQNERNFH